MGLRKIFRKVTRPIRKIIPKEIRPFVPYAASMFLPGIPGLPAAFSKYGGNEFIKAALTRGVIDDEADFRDVLRTGITAALPKLVETGGSKFLPKETYSGENQLAMLKATNNPALGDTGLATESYAKELAKRGYAEPVSTVAKNTKPSILKKVVDTASKLTSGSGLENLKAKATFGVTAGSMDEAAKLINQYEEGLDGPYDRKNDRGALFKIFEKAQWGTDDQINEMLDRYGYMGGGSVMPIQTGIAGALPMPNTRPGYDIGGGVMMASATGDESDDIAMELFGKGVKDLTPDEFRELQDEIERLQNKFRSEKDSKKGILMASHEGNTQLLEQLFEQYLELGFSPEDAAKKAREEFDRMGKMIDTKSDRVRAAEGGIMDLGGMEKDYRNDGGFVPIGEKERADDVPARLSLNEFVMTADAVRNAGDGDIDKGAEVMENVMKNLEEGGSISEESQGKEGARRMFNTMEGMEAVI